LTLTPLNSKHTIKFTHVKEKKVKISVREAINSAIADELERDETVFFLGKMRNNFSGEEVGSY
jgi:hypothetical protein